MKNKDKNKKRKPPIKYEFMHGRFGLAAIYGLVLGSILMIVTSTIMMSVPSLYRLFEESIVLFTISIMLPLFSPIIFMVIRPPTWLMINVKCIGILYNDYVEIHKGKRVRIQYYKDIKHVLKYSELRTGIIYRIGRVSIRPAVGARKMHLNSDKQLDKFLNAVQKRCRSGI